MRLTLAQGGAQLTTHPNAPGTHAPPRRSPAPPAAEALADGQRGVQRKQAKPFPAGAPEPLADALQTTREARSFVELLNRIGAQRVLIFLAFDCRGGTSPGVPAEPWPQRPCAERLHSPTAWEARQGSPATGESQHSASEPYQPERYSAGSAETSPGAATAEASGPPCTACLPALLRRDAMAG